MPKELIAKGISLLDKLYKETQEVIIEDTFTKKVEEIIEKITLLRKWKMTDNVERYIWD